ncbi:MAG: hypothetical protein NBV68_04330 [Erythrobacter sp.]|uniref:DUF6990 domain-containing protein n=1 Tax=Erythrobacter sp. TaxID=1042 RepID=UPI0025FEAADE|nr:hypothetical protein [Erythrobacter sp.]MCL9998585.1 hypothetical protein [Erythrobacter sp.]
MANQTELAQAFADRGWRVTRDETSQPCGELRVGDRVLLAILTKRSPVFAFHLSGWITTDALSVAYTVIFHPRKRVAESVPLVLSHEISIAREIASDEDIDGACAAWISFAQEANLEAGMAVLLDKEARPRGSGHAMHLSALAATGGGEVLESYAAAFSQGDRLGFVNYITAENIAAALAFAQRRRAEPGWLPRSPRLRV